MLEVCAVEIWRQEYFSMTRFLITKVILELGLGGCNMYIRWRILEKIFHVDGQFHLKEAPSMNMHGVFRE